LEVGFVSSVDGGNSWSTSTTLSPTAINLTWLANTTDGYMVGDYISTSFSDGKAFPLFITASAPNGSQFNEALFTTITGLTIVGGTNAASAEQVISSRSTAPVTRTAY